ncbi:MAG: SMC-Scp complex subunit ScpB [Planctomycetota bacterium]|nr:SMC-Scp complex subunit ScpB [Planctomycetota bacterium]
MTQFEKADKTTEIDPEDPRKARLRTEAVLLLSKTALSPRKLAQLAHLADATQARTLVRQLNKVYEDHRRAIRIENVAGGYRMFTHPSLSPWLTRLGHVPAAIRISTPMMETLAVVAYHQPVSRANAEAVRGVGCGEILRQLMERDLVRIFGRSEELGRPYLYGTTKRFLKIFGLKNIDALPPIQIDTLVDGSIEHSPNEDLSTPKKELVVSNTVAPVLEETEFTVVDPVSDSQKSSTSIEEHTQPMSEIEDEENQFYDDEDDEEEDDWASEEDDDWDEEDIDDEESDDDPENPDDDPEDTWEEVGDEESDDEDDWEDDEEDDDWEDDESDDDEDWD